MTARTYVGRHRPEVVNLVPAGHLLTPAAQQLVTRTQDPVHAGPADATGLLQVRNIRNTGAWTTPAAPAAEADVDTAVLDAAPPRWFGHDTDTREETSR